MVSFQHPAEEDEAEELFAHDISEVMEDMVRTELGMVQKPVAYMQKEDKLSIVGNLANRGIFDVRLPLNMWQSVWVLRIFTVYNYLKELRVKINRLHKKTVAFRIRKLPSFVLSDIMSASESTCLHD